MEHAAILPRGFGGAQIVWVACPVSDLVILGYGSRALIFSKFLGDVDVAGLGNNLETPG